MKITFFSNFMNHHQLMFCQELQELTNNHFIFVATTPVPEERLSLGYHDMNKIYPFVLTTYDSEENKKFAMKLAVDSDVVIHGAAPEAYVAKRMEVGKLTFRYLERLNKRGFLRAISPRMLIDVNRKHIVYRDKPLYVLCASAYTAKDLHFYGCYKNKCVKWGYFPEVKTHNIDDLIKKKDPLLILWAGRLIDWKHPEVAVFVAEQLKKENIPFKMRIIGNGSMEQKLKKMIQAKSLSSDVEMPGAMAPEEVRANMEEASVYLFTSDYQEGWGAVLNEAMNSACAVVANRAIGAVPFLIQDGYNGFFYVNGKLGDCTTYVKKLMGDVALRNKCGRSAYETLIDEWNAGNAARKFYALSESLQNGNDATQYETGVCSLAPWKI